MASIITGDNQNNFLQGYSDDDAIYGLGGDDFLVGGAGNDTLVGGTGNDQLDGNSGNNTYVFGRGDGFDVIMSHDYTQGKHNVISFVDGILPSDVTVLREQENLVLITNSGDKVTVQNFFMYTLDPAGPLRPWAIEQIAFSNGERWSVNDIIRHMLPPAVELGEGNDFFDGPHVNGNGGDDELSSFSWLGAILNGGAGNDRLRTGQGDDLLEGGAGNDVINAGGGLNTIVFARGWGQDTVELMDAASGFTTLQFNGLLPGEIRLARSQGEFGSAGNDLILTSKTGTDSITLLNYFGGSWYGPAGHAVRMTFLDGTTWSFMQVEQALWAPIGQTLVGTPGDESLLGGYDDDVLNGMGGQDVLDGGAGNDVLIGAAGQEIMIGGDGSDTYLPGAGDAFISVGMGNDLIVFGRDAGLYRLTEMWHGGTLTIDVAAAILPGELRLERYAGEVRILVGNSAASIVFPEMMLLDPVFAGKLQLCFADGKVWNATMLRNMLFSGTAMNDHIEGTFFADVMHGYDGDDHLMGLDGNDVLYGGNGNDSLFGFQGDDTLLGEDGYDHLEGHEGNDILAGGRGDDMLAGGPGNDTYRFNPLDGNDTIGLHYSGWGERSTQTLEFGAGIVPNDVTVVVTAWREMLLTVSDHRGSVRIVNFSLDDGLNGPEVLVKFTDGTVWRNEQLRALSLAGKDGDDVINGYDGDDILSGYGGNDRLFGAGGNDTLDGGTGNDELHGGFGADTYVFRLGDGYDVVSENPSSAEERALIRFGEGITESDVRFQQLGSNLLMYYGPNDRVWFNNVDVSAPGGQQIFNAFHFTGSGAVRTFEQLFFHAPEVGQPIAAPVAVEGQQFMWGIPYGSFTDKDEVDTHFAFELAMTDGSAVPAWIEFHSDGAFKGTPGADDGGLLKFTLTAIDKQGHRVSTTFSLTVEEGNRAPVVSQPIADQSAQDGAAFSFVLPANTFTDPDAGDSGTLSVSGMPVWMSLDPLTGTFSGQPGSTDIGDSTVTVTRTDAGGLTASDSFSVKVGPAAAMTLNGTAAADVLTGKSNDDTLSGFGGDDILDGGLGADIMRGGAGNDTMHVDNVGDLVIENGGEGYDTVVSTISYTLGPNLEKLMLGGTASVNATGNALNNTLIGNAGDNVLNGAGGADAMAGGDGNDTYVVDNGSDAVLETSATGGFDQVISSVGRTLGAHQEVLTLAGSVAIGGTGNALANVIQGNGAVNSLNGADGSDILQGMGGDDNLADGSAAGNLFDGGAGADRMAGGAGADMFIGGAGNDTISTGLGRDVIAFNRGDGKDSVAQSSGTDNTLSLGKGILYTDLSLSRVSNDLILTTGASETITFKGWYASATARSVATLQVVTEGGSDYVPGSTSVIHDHKVELFNFIGLVARFDQARLAEPTLANWGLAASMAEFSSGGSDSAAVGGDLAYQYALHGSLSSMSAQPALAIIGSATFGDGVQALQLGSALNDGLVVLY